MLIAIFNRLMKLAPAVQLSSFRRAIPVCEPCTGRPCRPYVVFLLLACLGAALSGCSGPPSANEGRQAIEDRIKRDSGGRIRLVQFQKTNGQLAEVMGVKVYSFEFETEIEFLEACKWNIRTFAGAIMDDELSFRTTKSPDKPLNELAQFTELATNPGTEVSKGQRFKLVGAIRFEKKEKGWWVDGVKVTSITPLTGSGNSSASQTGGVPEHQTSGTSKNATPTAGELDRIGRTSTTCANNLKQIGLALRTWGIDHDGDFPFNASTNRGGTKELCSVSSDGFDRNAFVHFMAMSNELALPKILLCPADSSKHPADDFKSLRADNVTYQLRSGTDINETHPGEIVLRCPIHGDVVHCDGNEVTSTTQQQSQMGSDNPSAEAERWFRQRYGSTPEDLKVVAYRNTTEEKFNDSYGEGCSLDFEAEFQVQTSTTENGVEVHRGDRVKYVGIIQVRNRERGWHFQNCRLHAVSASQDSLLAQIRAAEERSTSNNSYIWGQALVASASAGAPATMPRDATNGAPWRLRFHDFTH